MIYFRDVADSGHPNPKITISDSKQSDQQEPVDKNELSFIDDCDLVPPTIILNSQQLIVDFKYAYFHHDDEDVQNDANSFLHKNNLEPTALCSGSGCNEIET